MPKTQSTPAEPRKRRGRGSFFRNLFARERGSGWHWFDHPEMQARIAEAEADLREGRYESGTTVEGLVGNAPGSK